MPTKNKEREMGIAQRRVKGFTQQFGEAHRNLARHAAFPLVLTPDLLYQLWANFVPEAPWTAVARVLISRLCRQVGYEMYEIDIADRNLLLRELKEEFGQERFDELGKFLLDYVSQRLTDDDADTQDLREAQEWTALAYTKPDRLAQELAQRLGERMEQENTGEVLRLASLVETLAEPLVEAGFELLLIYSRGMEQFVRGNLESATNIFGTLRTAIRGQVEIAEVLLQIPELPTITPNESVVDDEKQVEYRTEQSTNSPFDRIFSRFSRPLENLASFWGDLQNQQATGTIDRLEDLFSPFQRDYYKALEYRCRDDETQGLDNEFTLELQKVFVPLKIASNYAGNAKQDIIPSSHNQPSSEITIWDCLAAKDKIKRFNKST